MTQPYPKRLIEVDLPIKRISAHSRREKSIRHGHISTLHVWWARRPLAACRSVICAALWPDPADPLCPQDFRDKASKLITEFANAAVTNKALGESCDHQTWIKWQSLTKTGGLDSRNEAHWNVLRFALLDFIADFANWDNSNVQEYLETSRALTQAAHEALGGEPNTRPLVVDPFAGGGSIPLEALRVGADAFASDLNPVAVLLNKVMLEFIPKYGQRLADEVRKWGEWIKCEAEKELADFYPKDSDGATPMAYLWARTVRCEGPSCGAEIPLIRSPWLAKRPKRSIRLQTVPSTDRKGVKFQIISKQRGGWADQEDSTRMVPDPTFEGTVKRGSATCPCCGFTTPVARVREQLRVRKGGTKDARLFCVIANGAGGAGRFFRLPYDRDINAAREAGKRLEAAALKHTGPFDLVPNEKLDLKGVRHTWAMIYGLENWSSYYTDRQALSLTTLVRLVTDVGRQMLQESEPAFATAVQACLALAMSREADKLSSLARWDTTRENPQGTFARQALPMLWDFNEVNPLSGAGGDWDTALDWVHRVCESQVKSSSTGTVEKASASDHPMPSDSADLFLTDPPYYDAVPYAYLSDYFYVWLRRALASALPDLFNSPSVPKDEEIVVDRPHELSNSTHDITFYERELTKAFGEGRRIIRSDGIGTIVFASKTTASWEAILKAVVEAGWMITGSWPIDTELENRVSAQGQARLASSVHLVCRPREGSGALVGSDPIGDWRDVLQELPRRIHEWMPRLAEEGVVGADAIFACLGPALEVFSRYSRVEKANGDPVALKEYLEHVWAAVAKEALAMVFRGADATGFEADARLSAMWLWTLKSPDTNGDPDKGDAEDDSEDESEIRKAKAVGFALEFDAARKIAQGLGADLETLSHLVEISGDQARLLPVSERTRHLFGKEEEEPTRATGKKKKSAQLDMFAELIESDEPEAAWREKTVKRVGETTLDRVHQGMILFAAGRGEALKRFIVEDGIGRDGKFWRLAQALSALYPSASDEKRWVDGVLARKKQFGF
jgi:adenine-specific DNA methylase